MNVSLSLPPELEFSTNPFYNAVVAIMQVLLTEYQKAPASVVAEKITVLRTTPSYVIVLVVEENEQLPSSVDTLLDSRNYVQISDEGGGKTNMIFALEEEGPDEGEIVDSVLYDTTSFGKAGRDICAFLLHDTLPEELKT